MFRRTIGTAAALLTASASLAVAGTASAAAAAGEPAPAAVCSTTSVIQIDGFAFNPATVYRGQSSAATLDAQNCTGQTQQVSVTWYGRYLSATGTGIPAGCPVIDPFVTSVSFPPFTAVSTSTGYPTFASCTATALQITVKIANSAGTQLAQATATLNILPPPAA